jgi:hypothetical protein
MVTKNSFLAAGASRSDHREPAFSQSVYDPKETFAFGVSEGSELYQGVSN